MASKLLVGVLVGAVAFLLATNPVVVEAVGQVGSAQIKDNSVKSKDVRDNGLTGTDLKTGTVDGTDVKDGSLTVTDLAGGTVPDELVQVRRWSGPVEDLAVDVTSWVFAGPVAQVTVDGNDLVVGSGEMNLSSAATGNDLDTSLCVKPTTGTTISPLGGSNAYLADVETLVGHNSLGASNAAVPTAGTYDVGLCVRPNQAFTGNDFANGWVQVVDGNAVMVRPSTRGTAAPDRVVTRR